jgi:hypothetical protein
MMNSEETRWHSMTKEEITPEFKQAEIGELIKLIMYDVPIDPLIENLNKHPELWAENTWRQDYVVDGERPVSPQKDTEAVMFRWAPENTIESVRDSLDIVDHENWAAFPEVQELVYGCAEAVGATEIGRVFVAKLKPGGVVIPHCDYGLYSDHFERFHLVLTSKPGNEFTVQNTREVRESVHMNPGEFFWFNHKEAHWAVNNSSEPRMHLIIDMVAKKYRRNRASI